MKRLNSSPISQESCDKSVLSHQDLKEAEESVLKFVLQQEFASEIKELKKGRHVKLSNNIRKLDPILDDGLNVLVVDITEQVCR